MLVWIAAFKLGLTILRKLQSDTNGKNVAKLMAARLADGDLSLADWTAFGKDLGLT